MLVVVQIEKRLAFLFLQSYDAAKKRLLNLTEHSELNSVKTLLKLILMLSKFMK